MQPAIPATRDIVLIGGGHTHALVLRMWGMRPLPGVRLTLVNPTPTATYSGMLPGHLAGHYPREALEIDLVRLARFAGARLILAAAEGIDPQARLVHLPGRPPLAWDIASIDVGVTSALPELPGFAEHGHPAKPLDGLADDWVRFLAEVAEGSRPPQVAVIGAGLAGVELALAAARRLRHEAGEAARVTLIERGAQAMPGVGRRARRRLLAALSRAGVRLLTGAEVTRVAPDHLRLGDGQELPAAFAIGAAGARPHPWLGATGLATENGYLRVGPDLRVEGQTAIFAAGDCAHMVHAPRPKAGVFAVRAAPVLFANLQALAEGRARLRRFRPQRDYLKLVSLGDRRALGEKWGVPFEGRWVWRWKDRIDRRFMARFEALPAMPAPRLPRHLAAGVREEMAGGKPLCAGCGSKVGQGALRSALAAVSLPRHEDLLSAPGDDAAVLRTGNTIQVMTTDHLRAFTEDPFLFARIAAVHALGDVWAMGARPQAALASIVLPRLSEELQERTLREIMAGLAEVLGKAGAGLAGGHTTQGAELTLGLSLTGLVEGRAVGLSGATPGDALLLTKALGTGVILAAEMARRASGAEVAGALCAMKRPLACDARILAPVAHAMTDVTGFGLAGHLMNILEASGVAARIELAAVPLLDGAARLATEGVRSTLFSANAAVLERMTVPNDPRADLLFDPQTAGGLIAAVPAGEADRLLGALRRAGAPAARIGTLVAGPPRIDVA